MSVSQWQADLTRLRALIERRENGEGVEAFQEGGERAELVPLRVLYDRVNELERKIARANGSILRPIRTGRGL